MRIWLIRHFQTQGNLERRYIGRTDEPILPGADKEVSFVVRRRSSQGQCFAADRQLGCCFKKSRIDL